MEVGSSGSHVAEPPQHQEALFDELVERRNPPVANGWRPAPTAPGWGVTLRDEVLATVQGLER